MKDDLLIEEIGTREISLPNIQVKQNLFTKGVATVLNLAKTTRFTTVNPRCLP